MICSQFSVIIKWDGYAPNDEQIFRRRLLSGVGGSIIYPDNRRKDLPAGSTVALTVSLGKPGVSIDYGGEQTVTVGETFTSGFYYALPDNGDPYCMRISSDSPAVRPQTDVMMIGGNNEPRSCMSSHWYYALAVGTATLTVQIGDQIQTCTIHVVA